MKKHTLASAVLVALSASAIAQENQENETVERIEVRSGYISGYNAHSASGASKFELPIAEIPQSVSVITSQQIEDFGLNDINSVLDSAVGISVERIETDRTYYRARGFDVTNFQIDGVGLPLIWGNNHAGEDSAIYDRIEVIGGANGMMTGVGNPSATINSIRKRPTAETQAAASVSYGSWGSARVEADVSTPAGETVAARVVALAEDKGSYLDRYSTQKHLTYFFVEANLSQDTQVSLSHNFVDNDAKGNLWGALPLYYSDGSATDYDRSTSTSADWSNWRVVRNNTILELTHTFNEDWHLRATYGHKSVDEESELFYVYGTPNKETELGLKGYASEYLHDETHDLADLYISGGFELFGRDHEVVAGANYAELEYQAKSLYDYTTDAGFPDMPDLNTWDGNAAKPVFTDGLTGADVVQTQKAVYATGRFNLADGLNLMVGARYNDWQAEGESYGTPQDETADDVIPYAGVVYRILPELVAYASYTETFLAQTELDINDKTLAPVVGESREIGFKSELFEGQLLATFTYFDIQQTNLAVLDPSTSHLPPTEQRYIGADGIGSEGIEISLAGEVYPGLNLNFGFTDFNMSGDDQTEATTPKTLVKLAAVYDVEAVDGLSAGINVRWQDDIYRVQGVVGEGFANAGEEIITRQDAYALVNLMARYALNDNISFSFNANNVTNEKYLNSLYWAQGYYGAPANYTVSLNWKL